MNAIRDISMIDRLVCAEHGAGVIEWRGLNMLIISYPNTTDETKSVETTTEETSQTASGGRHTTITTNTAVEESEPVTNSLTSRPSESDEPGLITRAAVLELLHQRTNLRLQRKHNTSTSQKVEGIPR